MKISKVTAALLSALIATSAWSATNDDEVSKLKQRVLELEQRVHEMEVLVQPLKAQQAVENRRGALRDRYDKKLSADRNKYKPDQLREAEGLYQVANQKWGSAEAADSLQTLIKRYPDMNRTGCAMLYVAQRSQGEARAKYLKECIGKYNDCFYGDGVQVGALARLFLIEVYRANGDEKKAMALSQEIKSSYPDAIDHSGNLLIDSIKAGPKPK